MLLLLLSFLLRCLSHPLRYFNQLTEHKKLSSLELKQEVKQLNAMLEQSLQAVEGIQELAQYNLTKPKELDEKTPPLVQDGEFFLFR